MIQRIQSIYLLAVTSIAIILMWVDPFYAEFESSSGIILGLSFCNNGSFLVDQQGQKVLYTPDLLSIILLIAVGAIAIVSVFLYKNRNLQMRVTKLLGLMVILYWVVLFVRFFLVSKQYADQYNLGVQIVWPLVLLIPVIMAYFAIKSDEDLISSMDRIR